MVCDDKLDKIGNNICNVNCEKIFINICDKIFMIHVIKLIYAVVHDDIYDGLVRLLFLFDNNFRKCMKISQF